MGWVWVELILAIRYLASCTGTHFPIETNLLVNSSGLPFQLLGWVQVDNLSWLINWSDLGWAYSWTLNPTWPDPLCNAPSSAGPQNSCLTYHHPYMAYISQIHHHRNHIYINQGPQKLITWLSEKVIVITTQKNTSINLNKYMPKRHRNPIAILFALDAGHTWPCSY